MSTQLTDGVVATTSLVGVECTVSVSRNAAGNLEDGVRARLESADGVDAVESLAFADLRPGLNDLTVTVSATLAVDDGTGLAGRLGSTFGVREVTVEARKGPP